MDLQNTTIKKFGVSKIFLQTLIQNSQQGHVEIKYISIVVNNKKCLSTKINKSGFNWLAVALSYRTVHIPTSVASTVCCFFLRRWIKFEEKVEKGGERWSKPHVATLSLHSLFELRTCIEKGTIMLDLEANTLPGVVGKCFFCSYFVLLMDALLP